MSDPRQPPTEEQLDPQPITARAPDPEPILAHIVATLLAAFGPALLLLLFDASVEDAGNRSFVGERAQIVLYAFWCFASGLVVALVRFAGPRRRTEVVIGAVLISLAAPLVLVGVDWFLAITGQQPGAEPFAGGDLLSARGVTALAILAFYSAIRFTIWLRYAHSPSFWWRLRALLPAKNETRFLPLDDVGAEFESTGCLLSGIAWGGLIASIVASMLVGDAPPETGAGVVAALLSSMVAWIVLAVEGIAFGATRAVLAAVLVGPTGGR